MSTESTAVNKNKKLIIQGTYKSAIDYCNAVFKKYFEFTFCYVSDNEIFRELDRFIWESKHEMRFQNYYEGVAVIDLSMWNKKEAYEFNEYFDAFFYYLKGNDKIHCVFLIDDYCSEQLLKKIKFFFNNVFLVDLHPKKSDSGKSKPIGFTVQERGAANV